MFGALGSLVMSQVRQTVGNYLPGTGAIIQAFGPVSDGEGGFTENWTPVSGGTVNYRIDPAMYGQLEMLALAEGVKVEYSIILPYNAPITVGNRIVIGGTAYNVRIMQPNISNIAFVKALVQRDQ